MQLISVKSCNLTLPDSYSDLGLIHRCCVCAICLQLVLLFMVVFDPVCDAQKDAQTMQTVHVLWIRLSHSDQDFFRLGLAQDTGEWLQEHLEVIFMRECTQHFLSELRE